MSLISCILDWWRPQLPDICRRGSRSLRRSASAALTRHGPSTEHQLLHQHPFATSTLSPPAAQTRHWLSHPHLGELALASAELLQAVHELHAQAGHLLQCVLMHIPAAQQQHMQGPYWMGPHA